MAAIFAKWNIRWNLERLVLTDTLWVKNFAKIALSRTVFKIQAFLCFVAFAKNLKIQNGRHFYGTKNIWKLGQLLSRVSYSAELPCGSKISSKSLYLAQFSRYKHFCVLHFW